MNRFGKDRGKCEVVVVGDSRGQNEEVEEEVRMRKELGDRHKNIRHSETSYTFRGSSTGV